jgi:hypothetical protein
LLKNRKKNKTTQILLPQRRKVIGEKYTSGGRIRTLPSKTARILYHLATQRHRNKITEEWKQPLLLRMEHHTMVKKLVKKRKRAKEGCEKKPPN